MPSFSENFLRGYQVGGEAKSRREREKIEREQLALHRQQVLTQLQRQEEDDKIREVQRGQQEALALLQLAEKSPRPQVPMPEGQAGPPAPAQVEPIQFPTFGGKMMPLTPRFQEDVQAQQLAAREAQGQIDVNLAVEKERQIAPIQAAAKAAAEMVNLPPEQARALGLQAGPQNKNLIDTAEIIFSQRSADRRQAAEIAARTKNGEDDTASGQLDYLADQIVKRNLDPSKLTKKTFEAVTTRLAAKGMQIPRALGAQEQKVAGMAEQGLAAVMDMERLYNEDPNVVKAAGVPTSLGRRISGAVTGTPAAIFEAARKRASDPEVRAATGAALNKDEQKFYGELQNTAFDDDATIRYKFRQSKALYAGLAGIPITVRMPDGREFTVQDVFNAQARHKMREAIRLGGEPLF